MATYKMELRVSTENLQTVLSVVEDVAQLLNLVLEQPLLGAAPPKKTRYSRADGERGIDVLYGVIKGAGHPVTQGALRAHWEKLGRNPGSISPLISTLTKEGKLKRTEDGRILAA